MGEQTGKLTIRMSFEVSANKFRTMTVHSKEYVTRGEAVEEVKSWLKLNDHVKQTDIQASWSFDESLWV